MNEVSKNIYTDIVTEDVIGGKLPEKYVEISGEKAYLEIDGQPVDKYFKK